MNKLASKVMRMIRGGKISPHGLERLGIPVDPASSVLPKPQTPTPGLFQRIKNRVMGASPATPSAPSPIVPNINKNYMEGLRNSNVQPQNYADAQKGKLYLSGEPLYRIPAPGNEFGEVLHGREIVQNLRKKWAGNPSAYDIDPTVKLIYDQHQQALKASMDPTNIFGVNYRNMAPKDVSSVTIAPAAKLKFSPEGKVVYRPDAKPIRGWGGDTRAKLYDDDATFRMNTVNRKAYIPNIREIKETVKNLPEADRDAAINYALAVAGHEVGHDKAFHRYSPEQVRGLMNMLQRHLGKTYTDRIRDYKGPSLFKMTADKGDLVSESLAQFLATRGKSRGAAASINLPIQTMKQTDPALFAQWENMLSGLPENIRNRLLAVRSHNYLNYGME